MAGPLPVRKRRVTVANVLKFEKKVAVVSMLVEGCSINSIVRMTGVHKTTILNLLVDVGDACADLLDANVRDVPACEVQVDEIWSYVGKKQGHLTPDDRMERPELGDAYTFVAIDADSKLIISHIVGKRDGWHANRFMKDVAMRVNGRRIQVTSDGFAPYVEAVEVAFGCDVDYAMAIKEYDGEDAGRGRYSPPRVKRVEKIPMVGNPRMEAISTSYVERQNLTMRMNMRRFTRLTNAFSKKLENLKAAVALHFAFYNFCRIHESLKVTPAMQAGLVGSMWTIADLVSWSESAVAQAA